MKKLTAAPAKVSPVVRQSHPQALSVFKDAYMLEFLNLPASHGEADLHRGLIENLKTFLIELGRFEPEHLGKLNFYLEALDRDACAHAFNPPCGAGASGNIRSNNTPQASPTAPGRDAQTGGFILSGVANAV